MNNEMTFSLTHDGKLDVKRTLQLHVQEEQPGVAAGTATGAGLGAATGAGIGVWFFAVGATPGSLIGGGVGAIAGFIGSF